MTTETAPTDSRGRAGQAGECRHPLSDTTRVRRHRRARWWCGRSSPSLRRQQLRQLGDDCGDSQPSGTAWDCSPWRVAVDDRRRVRPVGRLAARFLGHGDHAAGDAVRAGGFGWSLWPAVALGIPLACRASSTACWWSRRSYRRSSSRLARCSSSVASPLRSRGLRTNRTQLGSLTKCPGFGLADTLFGTQIRSVWRRVRHRHPVVGRAHCARCVIRCAPSSATGSSGSGGDANALATPVFR